MHGVQPPCLLLLGRSERSTVQDTATRNTVRTPVFHHPMPSHPTLHSTRATAAPPPAAHACSGRLRQTPSHGRRRPAACRPPPHGPAQGDPETPQGLQHWDKSNVIDTRKRMLHQRARPRALQHQSCPLSQHRHQHQHPPPTAAPGGVGTCPASPSSPVCIARGALLGVRIPTCPATPRHA